MKALVVGRGWIGGKVAGAFERRNSLITLISHGDAFEAIDALRPDVVVNCAGYTGRPNVDGCEKHRAETIEANTLYPIRLYEWCEKAKSRFAHFSTGCVYQGDGDFTEDTAPNYDASTYSASKIVSDLYLQDKAVVLRIRMPFDSSHSERNLLTKLEGYAKVARLVDSVNSISDADEMADVTARLLLANCPLGAYHLVNGGKISTREIAQSMGISAKWMDWEEFYMAGHGARSVCTLSNAKANAITPIDEVHHAVGRCCDWFRYHLEAA